MQCGTGDDGLAVQIDLHVFSKWTASLVDVHAPSASRGIDHSPAAGDPARCQPCVRTAQHALVAHLLLEALEDEDVADLADAVGVAGADLLRDGIAEDLGLLRARRNDEDGDLLVEHLDAGERAGCQRRRSSRCRTHVNLADVENLAVGDQTGLEMRLEDRGECRKGLRAS